jgi:hypothetical protein
MELEATRQAKLRELREAEARREKEEKEKMEKDRVGGFFEVMSGKMKGGLEKLGGGGPQEDKWWEEVPVGKLLNAPLDDDSVQFLLTQQVAVAEKLRDANMLDEQEQSKAQARERRMSMVAEPLASLGPFEMLTLNPRDINFIKEPTRPKYSLTLTGDLAKLKSPEWAFIGKSGWLSKWAAITLEGPARAAAGIPEQAAFFAWAFPLLGMTADASHQLLEGSQLPPAMYFVVNGGFVYADENLQPVQCNAVKGPGDELHFEGPFKLESAIRDQLILANRLRAPTIQHFLNKQITHFTWVEPGAPGIDAANGAFVYVYGEMDKQHDCFFRVSEASAASPGGSPARGARPPMTHDDSSDFAQ